MTYRFFVVGHCDVPATGQPELAQVFCGGTKGDGLWIGRMTGGMAGVVVGGPPRFGDVRGDRSFGGPGGLTAHAAVRGAPSPPGAARHARWAVWIDPATPVYEGPSSRFGGAR